jgi:ribokinase
VKKKIVMFGSYVTDLTGRCEHLPIAGETVFGEYFAMGPGGKGSNQTYAAYRAGADITLITKLGKDAFGDDALKNYEKEGISTEHVLIDDEKGTGIALICVDETRGRTRYL